MKRPGIKTRRVARPPVEAIATNRAPSDEIPARAIRATEIADFIEADLESLHGVHSVLWAMAGVMQCVFTRPTPSRSHLFELQRLARTGLELTGSLVERMTHEHERWTEYG